MEAIKNLFVSSKLFKEVNCTILALVPKVANPSLCNDFRSISCCNAICKCITKILVNRIKEALPWIIKET